jgi:hypothetical protein
MKAGGGRARASLGRRVGELAALRKGTNSGKCLCMNEPSDRRVWLTRFGPRVLCPDKGPQIPRIVRCVVA